MDVTRYSDGLECFVDRGNRIYRVPRICSKSALWRLKDLGLTARVRKMQTVVGLKQYNPAICFRRELEEPLFRVVGKSRVQQGLIAGSLAAVWKDGRTCHRGRRLGWIGVGQSFSTSARSFGSWPGNKDTLHTVSMGKGGIE